MIYMDNTANNYLINKLKGGNDLNITVLSHNSYWPGIQKLNNHFENCNVVVFGDSPSYIRCDNIQKYNKVENSDLIIFYSSDFYDEDELDELKNLAFRISNEKNKRVSIGYLYYIPVEEKSQDNVSQIEIVSFKNGEESTETMYPTSHFTTYDLVELTLTTTDNYDNDRHHKLEKKL